MTEEAAGKDNFKSGFVAIAGAPNVGKSTLLNRMLGEKISITSSRPQTTRNRILGILHRPAAQLVFIDTPGIHRARSPLNLRIVDAALSVLGDVDIILLVSDVSTAGSESEGLLLRKLRGQKRPVIAVLNKIDLLRNAQIPVIVEGASGRYPFAKVIPVSAKHGRGIDDLIAGMESLLPRGPAFFPPESLTDLPERFIAAELIREKVFRLTGQEIPYSAAVTIEEFQAVEAKNLVRIAASIHVEHDSQKGIIIGKGGAKLKQIGTAAREEIEKLTGARVFLKLFVRVQKNWSRDTKALQRFGY